MRSSDYLPLDATVDQITAAIVEAQGNCRVRLCKSPGHLAQRARRSVDRALAAAEAAGAQLGTPHARLDLWLWEAPDRPTDGDLTMVRVSNAGITALRGSPWTTRRQGDITLTLEEQA